MSRIAMTAEAFAGLLQARRSGEGRWQARCPAHADSSPSLSIREGQDGRVLLHCFAGCDLAEILTKLKLGISDLFQGPPPTRQQLATMQAEQSARERQRRKLRAWLAEPLTMERKFAAVADALAAKLAAVTDDDVLAKAYHEALDKARLWESEGLRRALLVKAGRDGAKG